MALNSRKRRKSRQGLQNLSGGYRMTVQAPFDMRLHVWVTTLQSRLSAGNDTDQAAASADLAVKALNKQFKADFRQKKDRVKATEAAIQGE